MGVTLRSPNRQRALVGVTWHRSALPLRIELLEPVGLGRLLRHEYGHCNGLIHPDGKLDKWREVAPRIEKSLRPSRTTNGWRLRDGAPRRVGEPRRKILEIEILEVRNIEQHAPPLCSC